MGKETNNNNSELPTVPLNQEGDAIFVSKDIKMLYALMQNSIEKQIEQNRFKDETIDRLQKIVNEYEKGFIPKIKEPLIWDLILFKDSFDKFKEKFEDAAKPILDEIEMLDEELDEIFYSHGIQPNLKVLEFYDRDTQIVKKKITTNELSDDKRIIKILKRGYFSDDKLLRKEEVMVMVFEANLENAEESTVIEF